MKPIIQYAKTFPDMNLSHIQKLNLKLYKHYLDLMRLYAFASGKRSLKNSSKKRSVDDERRLLWSVQNLKDQIKKIESEVSSFIEKYL